MNKVGEGYEFKDREERRTRKGLTGNDRSVGGGEEGDEGDEDECAAHFELSVGCNLGGRTLGFYTFVIGFLVDVVPESRTYVPYGYADLQCHYQGEGPL